MQNYHFTFLKLVKMIKRIYMTMVKHFMKVSDHSEIKSNKVAIVILNTKLDDNLLI